MANKCRRGTIASDMFGILQTACQMFSERNILKNERFVKKTGIRGTAAGAATNILRHRCGTARKGGRIKKKSPVDYR